MLNQILDLSSKVRLRPVVVVVVGVGWGGGCYTVYSQSDCNCQCFFFIFQMFKQSTLSFAHFNCKRSWGGPKGRQVERETQRNSCIAFLMVKMASSTNLGRLSTTTTSHNIAVILKLIGHVVLVNVWCWISILCSIDTCQNKVSAYQYQKTILRAQILRNQKLQGTAYEKRYQNRMCKRSD